MTSEEDFLEEVREVIEEGQEESRIEKKPIIDKKTGQVSIKLPRTIALRSDISEKSIFEIVRNPKRKETKEEIERARLVIYLKEVGDEKKEGT